MSSSFLVKQFIKEHEVIVAALQQVRDLGIGTDAGVRKLKAARAGLLAHLKKEDDKLYPVLEEAAKNDEHLKRQLQIFARDMDQISAAALEFFDKYAEGGKGIEFARDFGRLFSVLSSRIRKEENFLYKEYDKIVSLKEVEIR